ncbi:DUF983 domain-containing protein [Hyphomicrobium methylovorum]|uniref:DUF983 domain-containing protein n=1 Tax=Hyphomicrobium methylovorum TaxID=84 RepID=UPI003CCD9CD5
MADNLHEATFADETLPPRDAWQSIKRGWSCRCPACGTGNLYGKYLKVNDACPVCQAEMYHHRADDAPPYFVMTITGHVIVAGILILEKLASPPTWVQLSIWLPALVLLSLWLLPRVKGSLIGYQWALRMHGFGTPAVDVDIPPENPLPPVGADMPPGRY